MPARERAYSLELEAQRAAKGLPNRQYEVSQSVSLLLLLLLLLLLCANCCVRSSRSFFRFCRIFFLEKLLLNLMHKIKHYFFCIDAVRAHKGHCVAQHCVRRSDRWIRRRSQIRQRYSVQVYYFIYSFIAILIVFF